MATPSPIRRFRENRNPPSTTNTPSPKVRQTASSVLRIQKSHSVIKTSKKTQIESKTELDGIELVSDILNSKTNINLWNPDNRSFACYGLPTYFNVFCVLCAAFVSCFLIYHVLSLKTLLAVGIVTAFYFGLGFVISIYHLEEENYNSTQKYVQVLKTARMESEVIVEKARVSITSGQPEVESLRT